MTNLIETNLNDEGFNAEIEVNNNVIEKLSRVISNSAISSADDEKTFKILEYEVISKLHELDSNNKLNNDTIIKEEITLAFEDENYANSYDSMTISLNLTVGNRGNIEGIVTLKG